MGSSLSSSAAAAAESGSRKVFASSSSSSFVRERSRRWCSVAWKLIRIESEFVFDDDDVNSKSKTF